MDRKGSQNVEPNVGTRNIRRKNTPSPFIINIAKKGEGGLVVAKQNNFTTVVVESVF